MKHSRVHLLTLQLRDPAIRQEFKRKLEERALRWIPFFLGITLLRFTFIMVSIFLGSKETRCNLVFVVQAMVILSFFFVVTRSRPSAIAYVVPVLTITRVFIYFGFFILDQNEYVPWL